MRIIKFIDLFAGMGGLRKGFELALSTKGYIGECVLTSEIKPHAIKVYKDNYPGEEIVGDIRQINEVDIADFDILLAGFPCQAFSCAGKQLGFEDTRGTLFFEVARILKEKHPSAFILENVEGLVRHDLKNKKDPIGRTLEVILSTLKELGYKVSWKVLDASEFGVGQARRRIYIVGHKEKEISLDNFEKVYKTFGDVQEKGLPCIDSKFTKAVLNYINKNDLSLDYLYDKAIRDKRGSSNNIHSWTLGLRGVVNEVQHDFLEKLVTERRKREYAESKGYPLKDGLGLTEEEIKCFSNITRVELEDLVEKKYLKKVNLDNKYDILDINGGKLSFEFAKILDPTKPCLTLVATDVEKLAVIDNGGLRHLTLKECLRLQGFPDDYKLNIDYRKGLDLLGNTVVVPVITEISKRII